MGYNAGVEDTAMSQPARRKLVVFFSLLSLCIPFVIVWCIPRGEDLQECYERVSLGMTKKQVLRVFERSGARTELNDDEVATDKVLESEEGRYPYGVRGADFDCFLKTPQYVTIHYDSEGAVKWKGFFRVIERPSWPSRMWRKAKSWVVEDNEP